MAVVPLLRPPWDQLQKPSLYVGDLDPGVNELDLKAMFSQMGPIVSVRLCRCSITGKSLCYGYVNFYSHAQASRALALLNHTDVKGKPMRLMWCQRDPLARESGVGNLFVKNLDAAIDSACLHRIFCKFGTILSCKVAVENGNSKGFGFVQFDSKESAEAAEAALHDRLLQGKKLYVSKFVKKSERTAAAPCKEPKFTNLYVKNLEESMTEDTLKDMFSAFGNVSSAVIMKDQDGKSRGFGFVNFKSPEDATKAIDALNGSLVGSKTLFVGKAQNKAERKRILKEEYREMFNNKTENLKASNLYVRNLNVRIDDKKLRELFSTCGKILSAKVMCNDDGMSKGFGFVCFSSPEEAKMALDTLHETVVEGKVLYVARAQCKKDRLLEPKNSFAQRQPQFIYPSKCNTVFPPISPLYYNFPFYHSHSPFPPMQYRRYGANFGVQHPSATQHYQQSYSAYIPVGPTQLGSTGNNKEWSSQLNSTKFATSNTRSPDLSHGCVLDHKFWSNKKVNKSGGAGESIPKGTPHTACLAAAKSHGNSKKDIVEDPQSEQAKKATSMLMEMINSDGNKLPKSPKSMALQIDSEVQVPKEANALTTADGGAALPKSACCLSY